MDNRGISSDLKGSVVVGSRRNALIEINMAFALIPLATIAAAPQ
jgi:hypothetical protein